MKRMFLLFAVAALMAALAATMALAQPYEAQEIMVTGVLEEINPNPVAEEVQFVVNDEETGAQRPVLDCGRPGQEEIPFEDFVGQRVTAYGIPQTMGNPPSSFPNPDEIPICVTAIGPAGDSPEEGQLGQGFLGTEASEALYGTYGPDVIEGLGGDDLLVGEAGEDLIFGGPGDDFLVTAYAYFQEAPNAPASSDYVEGGPGDDLIDSADLAGAPDTVYCGTGNDLVYAGVEDFVGSDCEFVYRYFGY